MVTFPLAPGVWVDETDTLSLAVGSAPTAVPVICVGPSIKEPWWTEDSLPKLVNSFADYERYVKGETRSIPASVRALSGPAGSVRKATRRPGQGPAHWPRLSSMENTVSDSATNGNIDWGRHFAPALKAYFDNGGGYCYLCPSDKLDLVKGMRDVTLIVQAGERGIAELITSLCNSTPGLFGLLDGPDGEGAFDVNTLTDELENVSASDNTALFYPWLIADWNITDNTGERVTNISRVAPSAVMAGLICSVDSQQGFWIPPANKAVSGGLRPAVKVGDKNQAKFTSAGKTEKSVNMFREFPGRGTLAWGARTLTTDGGNWAYINVRRTFNIVERDIQSAMQSMLFEPNSSRTWSVVSAAIENYLYNLWRQGALSGASAAESFFIQVGEGVSMTRADIQEGILRVRIGLAVVRPAEFIILEFSQKQL